MKKIIVIGIGLVGKEIARDLAKQHSVTAVDINADALASLQQEGIKTQVVDITNTVALQEVITAHDLVIGAVPGYLGFGLSQTVVELGKNMVDISFFPEDPFALDKTAQNNGVTLVVDCGIAPGMSNLILGYHNHHMQISSFECLVGGLPVIREWPFEYKAVFSPIDVIEEYTRPARYKHNNVLIEKEALSDPELVFFDEIGTLESWNSDGLRTLLTTMPHIPTLIERTLRYPGCIEYLRMLRACGFFSSQEIEVKGKTIRPIDITAQLLFPKWKLQEKEEEFTVMRIHIRGQKNKKNTQLEYNLLNRTSSEGVLSMARTTGYTCTATAQLVLDGKISQPGVCPPEHVSADETNFRFILNYLSQRDVHFVCNQTSF